MSHTSPLLGDVGGGAAAGQSIEQQKQPAPTGWRSSIYIIGAEVTERYTYVGIMGNLVTYLTTILHQSTATAVKNVNVWTGTSTMVPLFGAFIADSYLGRYHTILFASLIYILGLVAMTLTTAMDKCQLQESLFFISLYIVVIGQGGHKPCVQVFGADQFDESSEEERRAKNSFFNWWYFGQCSGAIAAMLTVYYLQDNMGWTIGFGILAIVMSLGLILFLLGRRLYRRQAPSRSPLTHVAQALVAVARKLQLPSTIDDSGQKLENGWFHTRMDPRRLLPLSNYSRFLDNASTIDEIEWRLRSETQVEEVKLVLRLVPIWFSCLMYAVVTAQANTYFTKQSSTMDRKILSSFIVPSASLQLAISVSAILTVPIYEWFIVPITRRITGTPSGLRMLQRTGVGMFLSIIMMVVAALVERRRLEVARELQLVDLPDEIIPLSVLWMLPQYIIYGVSDVFISVGLQEFFYDQMAVEKRSMGAAAYLSIFGIGSFLSSGIISIVERIKPGWLVDNLNQAHLDYYYWLLAGLSTLWFGLFLCLAKWFRYK